MDYSIETCTCRLFCMDLTRIQDMRLRYSRTVKIICCCFVVISLSLQAKFSFYSRHEFSSVIDYDARSNFSINGSDVMFSSNQTNVTQFAAPQQSPMYHIGFLKVHKAGSTTMQNLLFRLALRHNLTILLPRNGNYLFNRGSAMTVKKGNHFDIFACHTVFSNSVFGLLPGDSVKIGIIRDPLERAISAAYYYRDVFGTGYLKRIPNDKFIENLVSNPEKYDPGQFSYTKNSMGKDFGFAGGLKNHNDKISAHLNFLKKEFKTVMVMERFEESLVLIKRELGWALEDIVFLQTNSHHHKPVNISDDQRKKFRDTCFLDYAIYDGFYPIFEEKIKAEGPSFLEEVSYFKSVLSKVKEFCDQGPPHKSSLLLSESQWHRKFEISRTECELMKKHEIKFINELRARHSAMQR